MRRNGYFQLLRSVPALARCSNRELLRVAALVDTIELAPGALIASTGREIVVALEPTRAAVVDRRALEAVHEVAPEFAAAG